MNTLDIARHHLENAAREHQTLAMQCNALVGLLKVMRPDSDEMIPVVALAGALIPFGLCIVHRDAVRNALTVVQETTDDEGLSMDDLRRLEEHLQGALVGRAS